MKIGIIGGGQLGMMMAEEAIPLGHSIYSLDPQIDCPISSFSEKHIAKDYSNNKAVTQLIKLSDVVTYEFENVDYSMVSEYEDVFPQKSSALFITQHRFREKSCADYLDIPTPKFSKIKSKKDLYFPSVIKTSSGGYDGKGQEVLRCQLDIDQLDISKDIEHIIEEYIDFDYEISTVITRDMFGNISTMPITVNTHKNGILFTSSTLSKIPDNIREKANDFSKRIISHLDYVGTMAIEYFVRGDQLIFNEYAPRPHNSGHYSIEGCNVSQFKNHILAITGKEIVPYKLEKHSLMINILGQDMHFIERGNKYPECNVHLYNKNDIKKNRKMGHITICSDDKSLIIKILDDITKE